MLKSKFSGAKINIMAYFATGNSCKAVDISSPAVGIPVKRVTLDHLSTAVASEDNQLYVALMNCKSWNCTDVIGVE